MAERRARGRGEGHRIGYNAIEMVARAWVPGGILAVVLLLTSCGGSSTAGRVSTDIATELQPGTTLHMVEVHYQRHGPAEDVLKLSESYQPETLRNESWMTFNEDGKLSDLRTESRAEDGELVGSTHLENGRLISEPDLLEGNQQINLADVTLESVKARLRQAITQTQSAIAAQPEAATVTIRSMATLQLELSRRAWTLLQGEITPGNYVSTYVHDLDPVEEVRRQYALPDGSYSLRSEWVAISADGSETIVESWDRLVFEVLD